VENPPPPCITFAKAMTAECVCRGTGMGDPECLMCAVPLIVAQVALPCTRVRVLWTSTCRSSFSLFLSRQLTNVLASVCVAFMNPCTTCHVGPDLHTDVFMRIYPLCTIQFHFATPQELAPIVGPFVSKEVMPEKWI